MIFSDTEIEQFVAEGYLMLRGGFPQAVAAEIREFIWHKIGLWEDCCMMPARPMVLVQKCFSGPPFDQIMNVRLKAALDELMGADRFVMHEEFGWWQVLLPGTPGPNKWHIDGASFHHHLTSREQGLVTIFFFSDIGAEDGGTRLVTGSHMDIARKLADAEPEGIEYLELNKNLPAIDTGKILDVRGSAGDVALLHPFLIHGFGRNRGKHVRFACNPQYQLKDSMKLERPDGSYSPVEIAIQRALSSS